MILTSEGGGERLGGPCFFVQQGGGQRQGGASDMGGGGYGSVVWLEWPLQLPAPRYSETNAPELLEDRVHPSENLRIRPLCQRLVRELPLVHLRTAAW